MTELLHRKLDSEPVLIQSSEENATFESLDKKIQRDLKRRSTLLGRVTMSLLLLSIPAAAGNTFLTDVRENQELAATSQPSINEILPADPNEAFDTATYYAAGFNIRDGDIFAQQVGVPIQNNIGGSAQSIDYGNAPLDPIEIAHQVTSDQQENDLDSVNLAGNSLGGIISVEVAEEIVVNSNVNLDTIVLNATPDGVQALRPSAQDQLYSIMDTLNIPGAKYSTFTRYIGTMILESGHFLNEDGFDLAKFFELSAVIQEQVQEQRPPGMWLLVDQALAITESNIQESLRAIGEQRGDKQMPTIIYLRAANPGDDVVVDVVESSENICAYAESAGLNCYVYYIENAPHTSTDFNTEEINRVLAENSLEIAESVASERAEHALNTYAHYSSEG